MCRYRYKTNKPHFVCFDCRKSFKKPAIEDYLRQKGQRDAFRRLSLSYSSIEILKSLEEEYSTTLDEIHESYQKTISICPDCGKVMANLGLDFKAPKKADIKAWRIITGMYHVGHSFHTCGCIGFGYVPTNKSEYREYLINRKKVYEDRLRRTAESSDMTEIEKQESRACWADRLVRVKKVLN